MIAYDWSGVYVLGGVLIGSALVLVGMWLALEEARGLSARDYEVDPGTAHLTYRGGGCVSDTWRNFGPVAGVFWIRGVGITLKPWGPLDGFHGPTFDAHRFWPFVIVWVPRAER